MRIEYDTNIGDVDAWHRYFVKLPQVAPALRLQSLATALASAAIIKKAHNGNAGHCAETEPHARLKALHQRSRS
jgi:hypothetical protein